MVHVDAAGRIRPAGVEDIREAVRLDPTIGRFLKCTGNPHSNIGYIIIGIIYSILILDILIL